MQTTDFDFSLPADLIAQSPAIPRDSSKLLVYDTNSDTIFHKHFRDLGEYLNANDTLVLNKSKVFPARINFQYGNKNLEVFILERINNNTFKVLVKPGKVFKKGFTFDINTEISFIVDDVLTDGSRILTFICEGDFFSKLNIIGQIPFPPYIKNAEKYSENYQTVFCDPEHCRSVAAPTAGLHFTSELIDSLKQQGVSFVDVVLNVGRGTFMPVKTKDLKDHVMHFEEFYLSKQSADFLNDKLAVNSRIIAVGTTSVRVLESSFDNEFREIQSKTDLFIYPGTYKFKVVDGLITNFHLPKSTLLMLVASFLENKGVKDPINKLLDIYSVAIKNNYRFYSFGDSMFIY
ncbi:MAG: tRNA preQ1(34) S-adenosylmethionine ribosyltransferase-isomerase QueA [Candidatus Gracilibacteria bacterium]|jgi:S-adenosylmethionine:tRNA ribosyltransferase-isomerase|nr:tRNA preQ1(34) S-adenosylmethionine ribosyltransferase-isomerase QueA [Candidatus Gracilibacteria bacterium]